ncbi:MAG: TPM domain-containing protein [Bacteroidota bacterium]
MPITGSITEQNLQELKAAIGSAEENTSGEIRLYLEEECEADVMDRAAFIFEKLGMHKTELRNGVLIYVAFGHKNGHHW